MSWLEAGRYLPHGHCYFWEPGLVYLHVASDGLIALAYLAISTTLVILVRRARGEIPFGWLVLSFGLFIVFCGFTHLMEIWTLYEGRYWLSGTVKALTAAASVTTAVALPLFAPNVLAMIRSARMSERRRADLEATHADLHTLFERLKESERARSEVFANVSHELRTPLALILGPARELYDDPTLDPQHRDLLATLIRNTRLLEKHVNDILLVAKGETGEVDLTPAYEEVDLAVLVRQTAANFDAIAQQRRMRFEVVAPDVLLCEVDPNAIERVVINLLSNAFKFTPDEGCVRVATEVVDDDRVRISVGDSGPGIDREHRNAVFERFTQTDAGATRRHGGFGLGLAIVRSFVQMHSGEVSIGTAPEGGALLSVSLPRTAPLDRPVARSNSRSSLEPEVITADLVSEIRRESSTSGFGRDRPTVLIVEDNREMNDFIAATLAKSYRTVSAYDGRSGLHLATANPPDLIVTDVMMPSMSGDELVRTALATEELHHVPILVVSAREDAELRTTMLRGGARDFVTKPFAPAELRARVRSLVEQKRARDLLSQELDSHRLGLDALAGQVAIQSRRLKRALEETQVAREVAEQAARMKTNLLRMMAHELRTPVAALQLQLTLLERSTPPLSQEQESILGRIRRGTQRLLELIETVLEYARIEAGRFELHVSSFSLSAVVQEVADDLAPHASQKALALEIEAPELPPLRSDEGLVRLIAVNLIGNAVKFTNEGGVSVRVDYDSGRHKLTVADTGPGIPPGMEKEVFEPFKQADDVLLRSGPGSGLGLALVKEMVRALGGEIRLTSGNGATFSVFLPSSDEAPEGEP